MINEMQETVLRLLLDNNNCQCCALIFHNVQINTMKHTQHAE